MVKFKFEKKIFWLFFLAIVLRLALIPFGNHDDLIVNAWWGRWMYVHGPLNFYQKGGSYLSDPTQAPLFNLLLMWTYKGYSGTLHLMDFLKFHFHIIPAAAIWWWERTYYAVTDFYWGYLIWMKVPAVLADVLTAVLVYKIGLRVADKRRALFVSALFLFLPFTWYVSALWGQYDPISNFLLLLAFVLLYKGALTPAALVYLLAGEMKPTVLIFVPLFVYYYFRQKPSVKNVTLSLGSALILFWLLAAPFTNTNVFTFTKDVMYPKVFFPGRLEGIANHSLNFWQLIYPEGGKSWVPIIGIPAFIWGYAAFFAVYIISFLVARRNGFRNLLVSLYLVSAGSYMFMIGMLDRYFYPAVMFLGLLTYFYPKLMKWWILISILFFVNLFYSWGFPFFGKDIAWQNDLLIRFLCICQIALVLGSVSEIFDLKLGIRFKKYASVVLPKHP